ncbi:hypothetical protein LCGC14_2438710 [marine sediment metagenome]|uniref:RNA polymerase sigma-70 region 4 domain-containing protein n=1 Tax=marine sediment metagenome TaxID=412755 RepID=A0A0F9DWL8_9ZZZZ
MNCSWVAVEAGDHPLQLIGEFLNISREGVRQIEKKALAKLREACKQADHGLQPDSTSGQDHIEPTYKGPKLEHEAHLLPALGGGELD